MKQVKSIIVILFLLIVVVVAVQNYQELTKPIQFRVNLLFYSGETSGVPVFLVAVIAFLIGVLCIWFYGISERLDFKRQIKMLKKDVADKEQELNSLRNLPVTSGDVGAEQPTADA